MQNNKVIRRTCLFMFVVGGGVSLYGMDCESNELIFLKNKVKKYGNISKEIRSRNENVQYIFQYFNFDSLSFTITEISKITVEWFDKNQNLNTKEIVEKITTNDNGEVQYWFRQHSGFKKKTIYTNNLKYIVMEPDTNKSCSREDSNFVKPKFDLYISNCAKQIRFYDSLLTHKK